MILPEPGGYPLDFSIMLGQSTLGNSLSVAVESGRVVQACIFLGEEGSGKRTAARIYAAMLLCKAPVSGKACGVCSSCRKLKSGNHPDLYFLSPAKDGGQIGVDAVRETLAQIPYKPVEGERCVVVVESAQDMTAQAQNALLKTLEEPPRHVVILLLCSQLHKILGTVISRCALYTLPRVPAQAMEQWLMDKGIARQRAHNAAIMADGRAGRALKLAQDEEYWLLEKEAMELLNHIARDGDFASSVKLLQDNRTNFAQIMVIWQAALRDALVNQSGVSLPPMSGEGAVLPYSREKLMSMLSVCVTAWERYNANMAYPMLVDSLIVELSGDQPV